MGPGDPELLTVKAVRVIRSVGCLAVPDTGGEKRTALDIVADYLGDQRIIDCEVPMTRDQSGVDAAMDRNVRAIREELDAGTDVAMVTLGDATVYSSFFPVHDRLVALGYEVEVVPGVTSFCAAAARLGMPLCQGNQNLLIVSAAGGADASLLDVRANKVFMKAGRALPGLRKELAARGQLEGSSLVCNLGMPDERVYPSLGDVDGAAGYFSLVLTRDVPTNKVSAEEADHE